MHSPRDRNALPKQALFSSPTQKHMVEAAFPRETDVLDKLEGEVKVLGEFHFQEANVERALKEYLVCLHELSDTEHRLSIEMKRLQPYASFNIWGNLFFEAGECHKELQELRTDTHDQIDNKVLQPLKQPRNSERQRVRKKLGQQVKKFRELSVKRASAMQHKDITSHELVLSLRIEVVELQLQKDALQYAAAFNAHQYHTLLSIITQAVALQHRHHERGCVRLLELQPMWRELQNASFGAPPEDVLKWLADNVPDEPPSLGRSLSQRFLPQSSPRNRPQRLSRKNGSGATSTNSSPRTTEGLKLSPRQMEKQPAPPLPSGDLAVSPSLRGLEPVSDPRPPRHSRPVEPIDGAAAPAPASAQPAAISASSSAVSPSGSATLASGSAARPSTPPAAGSPRSASDIGSRHALQRRVAELEAVLRDVRTAVANVERTVPSEELKGALRNVILLATPSSPRSAAAGGLPPNAALPPSSPRSSISVPATALRNSRSSKRLSMAAAEQVRELMALLDELPPHSTQTPTYQLLAQLLSEPTKPSTSTTSPVLPRSGTSIPAAPTTALQLHKGRSSPPSASTSLGMRDLMTQLLVQIKHESEVEGRK